MDITPLVSEGKQIIDSYGPGMFRVSGMVHRGSVLVFPDRTIPWRVSCLDGLTAEDFAEVATSGTAVDVLLIGCGERMQLVPAAVKGALRRDGIGVEPMDTGAACRTYNVLAAEGRRVAAALIAL